MKAPDTGSSFQAMQKRLLVLEQTLQQVQQVVMQLFAGYQAMAKYLDDTALGSPGFTDGREPEAAREQLQLSGLAETPPAEPRTSPAP